MSVTAAVAVLHIEIDTLGTDPGTALIYCAEDERLDGRSSRTDGRYYMDTYGDHEQAGTPNSYHVYVERSTRKTAITAAARKLGYTCPIEFTYVKD